MSESIHAIGRQLVLLLGTGVAFSLAVATVWACSSDYPIWMIRSKTADPLYRFVMNRKGGYINRAGKVIIKPTFEVFGNW